MLDLEKVLWGINTFAGLASGAVQIYDSVVNQNDTSGAIQHGANTLQNLGNQLQHYSEIYSQSRTNIVDNSQVVPVIQPDVMPSVPFNPPIMGQQPQPPMPYCCNPAPIYFYPPQVYGYQGYQPFYR